jgi:hypothetical protein
MSNKKKPWQLYRKQLFAPELANSQKVRMRGDGMIEIGKPLKAMNSHAALVLAAYLLIAADPSPAAEAFTKILSQIAQRVEVERP